MHPDRPRWHCTHCQALNYGSAHDCDACGVGSEGSGATSPDLPQMLLDDKLLFFPEAAFAALVAVISPVWFLILLVRGRIGAALVLAIGVGSSATGFIHALRDGQKAVAYACMLALVGTGALVLDTPG